LYQKKLIHIVVVWTTILRQAEMKSKVYTLAEAAALTRLSPDAIREAAKGKRIQAAKLGKQWLVLKEPFDRLLAGETAA
jgi:excisionase family DNA binding protein